MEASFGPGGLILALNLILHDTCRIYEREMIDKCVIETQAFCMQVESTIAHTISCMSVQTEQSSIAYFVRIGVV